MNVTRAYSCKLLAVVLGSTGPSVFMRFVERTDYYSGVMYFLIFGGLSMLAMTCIMARLKMFSSDENASELLVTSTQLKAMFWIIFGSLTTAITYMSYVYAMQLKSVTETVLIVRVGPVFSVVLALFILNEGIRSWKGFALAVCICLSGIIVTENIQSTAVDDLLSLFVLTALATTVLLSLSQVIERNIHKISMLPKSYIAGLTMSGAGLLVLILAILTRHTIPAPNLFQLLVLFYLGFGTIGIPKFLNLSAYHLVDNFSRLAFIDYLFPILATVNAYVIKGERGFKYSNLVAGFLLISIGIWIADRSICKNNQKKEM